MIVLIMPYSSAHSYVPALFLYAGVMEIGTIAGIAASIVVAILIVVLLAVTLMVCYSKCQPQSTSYLAKVKSSDVGTFNGNLGCSPTPVNDTTLVEANKAINCQNSVDSGHPHEDSEDTTSSGGQEEFILSVQQEDERETPAKPTEGDSISEESISLENFGEQEMPL